MAKWLTNLFEEIRLFFESVFHDPHEDPMNLPMNQDTPPEPPIMPPDAPKPPTPSISMLEHFCVALRDYEGKPGDLNYRNNNPGNCRCSSVGYLKKYGDVKCVNGFAKFPTYELGWEYLLALIKSKIKQHPTWTIRDLMRHYAPVEDNNDPDRYAAYLASRLAVTPDYPMSKIVNA